jgi:hypothetical protein
MLEWSTGLLEDRGQLGGEVLVPIDQERVRHPKLAGAAAPADPVHVVVDRHAKREVDHVGHPSDVEPASCHVRGLGVGKT